MTTKKERYRKDIEKITNEAMEALHPITKKTAASAMDLLKVFTGDVIEEIFNKKKKGRK